MYSHSEFSLHLPNLISLHSDGYSSQEHTHDTTSVQSSQYPSDAQFIQFVNSAAEEIITLQKIIKAKIEEFTEMVRVEEEKNDALRKELDEYREDAALSLPKLEDLSFSSEAANETPIFYIASSDESIAISKAQSINFHEKIDLISSANAAADEIINLVKIVKEDVEKMIQRLKQAQENNYELKKKVAAKKIKESLECGEDQEAVRQIVTSFALQLDVTEEKLIEKIDDLWARLPKIEEKLSEKQKRECDNKTLHETTDARSFVQLFAFLNEFECNGCLDFTDLNLYHHGSVKTLRSLSIQFSKEVKFRHSLKVRSRLRTIENIYRIMKVASAEEAVAVLQEENIVHPLIFRLHQEKSSYHLYIINRSMQIEGGIQRAVLALVAFRFFRLIPPTHLDAELLMWFLRHATGIDKEPLGKWDGVKLALDAIK